MSKEELIWKRSRKPVYQAEKNFQVPLWRLLVSEAGPVCDAHGNFCDCDWELLRQSNKHRSTNEIIGMWQNNLLFHKKIFDIIAVK